MNEVYPGDEAMEAQNADPQILIVDDTPKNLQVLGTVLKKEGYSIIVAQNGLQALEATEKVPPDLILLDVMMPELDGFETCKRLKENPETREIPVIFLTARIETEDIVKGFDFGAVDYVTKPFNATELLARCRTHLTLRRLQLHLGQLVDERTRELQLAVAALRGRDALLKHMLYLHKPEETLGMAVKLALELCGCETGALYTLDTDGRMVLRTAVGFQQPGVPVEDPGSLGLEGADEATFTEAIENLKPSLTQDPSAARRRFDIHSFGVLPICRGEELLALLELGRNRQNALVEAVQLEALEEFLPYVVMAVVDCRLQEEVPDWSGDVDEILRETDEWTE